MESYMKNIKNKLFVILAITNSAMLLPHGGGGFATGALVGTGITLAATSGNRGSQDPETARVKSIDRRIRQKESALRRAEKRGDERTAARLRKEINDLDAQL